MKQQMIMKQLLIYSLFLAMPCSLLAQSSRTTIDLSKNNWKLWLDTAAKWQDDALFAPPVNLLSIPINQPTGGWNALQKAIGKTVTLPATVEEYYWGSNGNSFGVSGNYLGVSWFSTSFAIDASQKGKRIVLQFEAVRFRAEIYLNKQLVGYDLVNSTPFEVDITNYIKYGAANELAVRITDPNGNFDWRDSQTFMWSSYRTNPTHGFGGITGKIKLVATNKIYTSDIFIKNKQKMNEVDAQLTITNNSNKAVDGNLLVHVKEAKPNGKIVFKQSFPLASVPAGDYTKSITIAVNNAALWSPDNPALYTLTAEWNGKDNSIDETSQRFGFRWFEVKDIDGDKQFYLNGKRIVLLTAISWGFWPVNGIAPSDELAKKQIMAAKKLGMNMLNFHRAIGNENVLNYADELGLLYFEEPGGNQYPANMFYPKDEAGKKQANFYFATRNEKLFRMIKRDRSHPSLIIYNLHNERGAEPQLEDSTQMQLAHHLDETRIITYNSSNGSIKMGPDPRFKLHLFPYDTTFKNYGWFDQHHAGGPGTYHNNLYNNPTNYLRYTDHKDEIIYYGEEGAIGTPPRLQLIRDEILKTGKSRGWETDAYLKWYDAYNSFIKQDGFNKAYPNVDSLTRKMGNVAFYYQGRAIENIRINNTTDGYAINGWESMKLENHSGVVDNYRNLKGDASLIARYSQPLYVAVKINKKVLAVGDTAIVDFFIVNQKDVKGNLILEAKATDVNGKTVWTKNIPVKLSGGNVYGELLSAGNRFAAGTDGYTSVQATLKSNSEIIAKGIDEIYAVKFDINNISNNGMVADTTGALQNYLEAAGIKQVKSYRSGRPQGKYLLVGAFEPQQTGNPLVTDILEWVNEGNTLIVVGNTDKWADHLSKKEVLDYTGTKTLGTSWYGGNYFSKEHALFKGLPQASVFNWEYQCFATYNKQRSGLRLFNGETIVASVSDHKPEVYSALSIVPHGRGKIIISTLDFYSCIKDVKAEKKAEGDGENAAMNTFNASQKNSANIVGQQLLMNMLKFALAK
jgi:beta-galactosidase